MANMKNSPFVYTHVLQAGKILEGEWFFWMGELYEVIEDDPEHPQEMCVKTLSTGYSCSFNPYCDVLPVKKPKVFAS